MRVKYIAVWVGKVKSDGVLQFGKSQGCFGKCQPLKEPFDILEILFRDRSE
jgi:hypothetical protein